MAMRVLSGISVIFIPVALLDIIECVPTSSETNPSLAAPTLQFTALMTEIMFEALTEWSPGVVGYLLTGVVTGHI